jgi:hypothetical protein
VRWAGGRTRKRFEVLPAGRPSDDAAGARDSDATRSPEQPRHEPRQTAPGPKKLRPRSNCEVAAGSRFPNEWAREELNLRPHAYQAPTRPIKVRRKGDFQREACAICPDWRGSRSDLVGINRQRNRQPARGRRSLARLALIDPPLHRQRTGLLERETDAGFMRHRP